MTDPIPHMLTPRYPELEYDAPDWAVELIRILYNKDRFIENFIRPQTGFTVDTAATTTFSGTSITTVPFENTIVDLGGKWDGTDSFYTPITGLYLFSCDLSFDTTSTNNKAWQMALVTPGNTYDHMFDTPNAAGLVHSQEVQFPLTHMKAGEAAHIILQGITGSGTLTLTGVPTDNWFSGHLVEVV